jgi:hypothetical protein
LVEHVYESDVEVCRVCSECEVDDGEC